MAQQHGEAKRDGGGVVYDDEPIELVHDEP
ncbi:hypothetical protein CHEID_02400 [Corynebacterium heidelbergense]|nr:hypothetical protein CHEID_02400 [Corynebacterium heidelbergense]